MERPEYQLQQSSDPFHIRIHEEFEEFLRDLTLEFPFPEIFETLRQKEFQTRFGSKVLPFPRSKLQRDRMRDIHERLQSFVARLESDFGRHYTEVIREALRYYTQTTIE